MNGEFYAAAALLQEKQPWIPVVWGAELVTEWF